jgi:leader peptidase (prepilin peptidase)/N-methyltransferase
VNYVLYAILVLLGAALGGQVNRGIYRLAWYRRPIGPWSDPQPEAPPRRWLDRIPVLGWLGLRRESALHGAGFWIRPLLIELALGLGLAWLYWWEVACGALLPRGVRPPWDLTLLHAQYVSHVLLISLMTVATFIDFDEQTIPDAITVPGALLGLLLMAACPTAAPLVAELAGPLAVQAAPLQLTSPLLWPASLDGTAGLGYGLACFAGWWFAVWPRTATLRRGLRKGVQYFFVSMVRYPYWRQRLLLLLLGCGGIVFAWHLPAPHWRSLLTALVGMAFGGGLIWSVRIVGSAALGKEAMGFGDVTLMALIGTFLGWQASLIVFFLAPFVAVVICLAQWLLTRRRDIAFGPYLCGAALVVMLTWSPLWEERAKGVFYLGWLVPGLLAACLTLLGGMLYLWRIIERALFGSADRDQP